MIKLWILLILLYGIFKGLREVLKKKSIEKHSVIEVLFFYTLFAFFMTIPFSVNKGILDVSLKYHIAIFIKSFVVGTGVLGGPYKKQFDKIPRFAGGISISGKALKLLAAHKCAFYWPASHATVTCHP